MQIELNKKQTVFTFVCAAMIVVFAAIGVAHAFSIVDKKMVSHRVEQEKQTAKAHTIIGNAEAGDIIIFSAYNAVSAWRQNAGFIEWVGNDFSVSVLQPAMANHRRILSWDDIETLHIEIIKSSDQKWSETALKIVRGTY